MLINRNQLCTDLAKRCDYYKKACQVVVDELDALLKDYFSSATLDESVVVQIGNGFKVEAKIAPACDSVDPRDLSQVHCDDKVRLKAKFTTTFKNAVQQMYDKKNQKKST